MKNLAIHIHIKLLCSLNWSKSRIYETQNQSALEIKLQVEKQLVEKEKVEQSIPSSIVIGPFYINTEPVRQNLTKKCKALVQALLDLLARQLRKQADQVRRGSIQLK